MNFNQYFCNLDQAYLMATNTSKISGAIIEEYKSNYMYNVPGGQQLSLIFNERPKIITIRINTNYEKTYHYSYQDKYYHASEIEAISYHEGFKGPFFSRVKEGVDRKTFKDILLITRSVYL